jgi:riboflavin biosynthesis pyrimidine reductase
MLQSTKLRLFNNQSRAPMPPRTSIAPLQTLLASRRGRAVPLPKKLARLFGVLRMPQALAGPHIISNFVSTLDGVVSLKIPGHEGGGDISGFSAQDRMVMGLLRAIADVVIVGGGSLEADPTRMWTPQAICPELAAEYRTLTRTLRKDRTTLPVVVSASGRLDLGSPVFARRDAPLLIVTTRGGARRLAGQPMPEGVQVRAVGRGTGALGAGDIIDAVCAVAPAGRILVEGGPRLLASFYTQRRVHEQFLTLAPQLAGREDGDGRISLVMGELFAPVTPRWASLVDVRRGGSHLFLRYSFDRAAAHGRTAGPSRRTVGPRRA